MMYMLVFLIGLIMGSAGTIALAVCFVSRDESRAEEEMLKDYETFD